MTKTKISTITLRIVELIKKLPDEMRTVVLASALAAKIIDTQELPASEKTVEDLAEELISRGESWCEMRVRMAELTDEESAVARDVSAIYSVLDRERPYDAMAALGQALCSIVVAENQFPQDKLVDLSMDLNETLRRTTLEWLSRMKMLSN
jgi:hypothetical protein